MNIKCADWMCRFNIVYCSKKTNQKRMQICNGMQRGVSRHRYAANFTAHPICIKMQKTVYCTTNLHIQNASVIDP
jgi:hypothetical protein